MIEVRAFRHVVFPLGIQSSSVLPAWKLVILGGGKEANLEVVLSLGSPKPGSYWMGTSLVGRPEFVGKR